MFLRVVFIVLLTDFDSVVERIRADPKSSDCHICGLVRLEQQGPKFLAIAAVASYVPESHLLDLLEGSLIACLER